MMEVLGIGLTIAFVAIAYIGIYSMGVTFQQSGKRFIITDFIALLGFCNTMVTAVIGFLLWGIAGMGGGNGDWIFPAFFTGLAATLLALFGTVVAARSIRSAWFFAASGGSWFVFLLALNSVYKIFPMKLDKLNIEGLLMFFGPMLLSLTIAAIQVFTSVRSKEAGGRSD